MLLVNITVISCMTFYSSRGLNMEECIDEFLSISETLNGYGTHKFDLYVSTLYICCLEWKLFATLKLALDCEGWITSWVYWHAVVIVIKDLYILWESTFNSFQLPCLVQSHLFSQFVHSYVFVTQCYTWQNQLFQPFREFTFCKKLKQLLFLSVHALMHVKKWLNTFIIIILIVFVFITGQS